MPDKLRSGREVELTMQDDTLIVRLANRPREEWDEQLRLMAERGDDRLLDETAACLTEWDATEWEWS